MRIVPELRFFVDDSLDYIDKIDELLKIHSSIRIPLFVTGHQFNPGMNCLCLLLKRYLFSKKKQNAINIISVISVVGVCYRNFGIGNHLICFQWHRSVITKECGQSFTPDLVISPLTGKFSHFDDFFVSGTSQ